MTSLSAVGELALGEQPSSGAAIVISSAASWQGVQARPWEFQRGLPGWRNYMAPFVFYVPTTDLERNLTQAGFQGSNERPQQYMRGAPTSASYYRQNIFWTPILDKDRGIVQSAWQGSNVRPLQFQHGSEAWLNYQRPFVFRTNITDQDRGITAAAFQGSNVRPGIQTQALNYLRPFYWQQAEPIAFQWPISGRVITYQFNALNLTFGVTCNYQSEVPITTTFSSLAPLTDVFIKEAPLVTALSSEAPLTDSFTKETPLVVSWSSDSPYCKPGQS